MKFLTALEETIESRKTAATEWSYTARLFEEGIHKIAKKVGEEGVEVAIAAVRADKQEIVNESADLVFHLLVLLAANDLKLNDVVAELEKRHSKKVG